MPNETPQEWNYCCDLMSIFTASNQTEEFLQKYIGPEAGITALLHAGMHWGVGSIADRTATSGWGRRAGMPGRAAPAAHEAAPRAHAQMHSRTPGTQQHAPHSVHTPCWRRARQSCRRVHSSCINAHAHACQQALEHLLASAALASASSHAPRPIDVLVPAHAPSWRRLLRRVHLSERDAALLCAPRQH